MHCTRRDSNPRRPDSKSGALSTELRVPSMSAAGLEPATCSFGRSRSIRLSYADAAMRNTPGRNRTCGLRLRKPALFPLSYGCLVAPVQTDAADGTKVGEPGRVTGTP